MSIPRDQLEASFRGVPFLILTEGETGGKKNVIHEYPNSQKRFVEELGTLQSTFSISAIVHGADAVQRRLRLTQALNEGGRGLLIHPSLGQRNVVATDWDIAFTDNENGKFVFDITFVQSEENVSLNPASANPQFISSLANQTKSSLDLAFVDKYINTTSTDVLKTLNTKTNGFLDQLNAVSTLLPSGVVPEQLTEFKRILERSRNITSISVRNGSSLSELLRSNFSAFESISTFISGYSASWEDLTTFGTGRLAKPQTTAKRVSEQNNLLAIEDYVRVNALIGLYESASYTTFDTETELLKSQTLLENAYNTIVQQAPEESIVYDNDLRFGINELRVETRDIFEQQLQNVWRIVDINPNETSIALTSYRYYGSLDQLNSLKNLNESVNVSLSDQTLKGLT